MNTPTTANPAKTCESANPKFTTRLPCAAIKGQTVRRSHAHTIVLRTKCTTYDNMKCRPLRNLHKTYLRLLCALPKHCRDCIAENRQIRRTIITSQLQGSASDSGVCAA